MPVYATNGAKVYIGGVHTGDLDMVESDFDSETWTEIKEVESIGTFGDTSSAIEFTAIGDGRVRRAKGPRNAGDMELIYGVDYSDAGQAALLAAEKSVNNYRFKLVLNDAPDGGTPSERKFVGMVGGEAETFGAATDTTKGSSTIWINSNVVRLAAAEAA